MGELSMHEAALQREQRARDRAGRALEHQRLAELEAEAATDPDMARMHREEGRRMAARLACIKRPA